MNDYWCIPPKENAEFVAAMEDILDIYEKPYDPSLPVVCMDEKPYQCLGETREPLPMIARAVRYANIRAGWNSLSREQKMEQDPSRTMAHDAFIMSTNIVARTQGSTGAEWRDRLSDDRKRIGDFACYIALFQGIEAR